MATRLLNKKQWTKDGRKWVFYLFNYNIDGTRNRYTSEAYHTETKAKEEERLYIIKNQAKAKNNIDYTTMTFKDLYVAFYNYKKDKVKQTTLRTYRDRIKHFPMLDDIIVTDFNLKHYELWKEHMNSLSISNEYKNDILKLLKVLLNFAEKWHDINISHIYKKMAGFTDPNEIPRQMQFYTFEEFVKFISVETDIKYIAAFNTLYYCGLRRGELRGLTWNDINFIDKTLSVNKNIVEARNGKKYLVTSPKTKSSIRTLPMSDTLIESLKNLYETTKNCHSFNNNWYVFGDDEPISSSAILYRKRKNSVLAGLKEIRLHDFRHSCASLLINNNANITIVAKYLGHTKIDETLNTYAHMFKNVLIEVVDCINKLEIKQY